MPTITNAQLVNRKNFTIESIKNCQTGTVHICFGSNFFRADMFVSARPYELDESELKGICLRFRVIGSEAISESLYLFETEAERLAAMDKLAEALKTI